MLCFYVRMYSTRAISKITLEDLPRLKREFQERTIDQKFLAEDYSIATLNINNDSKQRKASLYSPSGGSMESKSSAPAPVPLSISSPAASQPPPENNSNTNAQEKEKHKGRASIIPSNQTVNQIKKPLNDENGELSSEVVASVAADAPPPPPPRPKSQEKTAIALYDYVPDGHGIPLTRGEIVIIQDNSDANWWLVRNSNGVDGWAPGTYLQLNP